MRKFLVIGSAGTIGRNLVEYLKEKNEDYQEADIVYNDFRHIDIVYGFDVERHFTDYEPTHVIHLAATVGRVLNSSDHLNSLNVNVIGTFNVIQACMKYKAKMVYIDTSEAYGHLFESTAILQEGLLDNGFPMFGGIYGMTKLMAEKLVEFYDYNGFLRSSVARIFMCYAADGSNSNKKCAIMRMFASAMANEPVLVHENTTRSWCYVDDIVHGIYLVAVKGGTTYNIGNEFDTISSIDLAEKIIKLCDSKSLILFKPADADIYHHKNFSTARAIMELGYRAEVGIDEGLRRVYAWLKK